MQYISKDELVNVLNGLIRAREGKNCSRQVIIEYQFLKYILNIVLNMKVYEAD